MNDLAQAVIDGDRRAVARLLTLVENAPLQARQALQALYPSTGHAHIIGVTGAPGTGKSTLVNELALELRRRQRTVGILAIDPSSPFTGGAILADRLRMREAAGDSGVFIRSMATRGALGGLARAAVDAVRVLDAFGCDVILLETVGVGQDEVDVARAAHTTLVIQMPTLGDDIQTLKAGIIEIADILVLNKADLPGADAARLALQMLVDSDPGDWRRPIVPTVATDGSGVPALCDAAEQHAVYLRTSGGMQRRSRQQALEDVLRLLRDELEQRALAQLPAGVLDDYVQRIAGRQLDPYTAAGELAAMI